MGPTVPFWALELGDHAVTAVRVKKTPDGALEVLAWWTVPVSAGEDPVAAALRAIRRRGLREHGFQVVLPGRGATCRSCRIAAEDADLSPGEMEHELFDLTPFEPEESLLRTRRLGGPGVLDYRVVSERREVLSRVEKAFEEAGVRHLGLAVAPAALMTAVEALGLGPPRGFALEVRGDWSVLTAMDGPQSVRFPVPFGIRDAERALSGDGLESALDGEPGSSGVAALTAALDPLAQDLRRAAEFHRAVNHGSGGESLVLVGPGSERKGLRAALAASPPAPLAPPLRLDPAGRVRPGPRVKPAALEAVLPLLAIPLGAAASAAGIAPRDLDFRNLPDDLHPPPEGDYLPLAAGVLVAGLLASFVLASSTRTALAGAKAAASDVPPTAAPGVIPAREAGAKAEELDSLVERARSRAALRRSLNALLAAFPRSGDASSRLPFGAERIRVTDEGGNYRVQIDLRISGTPLHGDAERQRLAPLADRLSESGWRMVETKAGVAAFERLEMRREGPGR